MKSAELIDILERINVTLEAIKDAFMLAKSDKTAEEVAKLRETVSNCQNVLETHGDMARVARVNRELVEQIAMIRDVASDALEGE